MVGGREDRQKEQRMPELTGSTRQLSHSVYPLTSFWGRDIYLGVAFPLSGQPRVKQSQRT